MSVVADTMSDAAVMLQEQQTVAGLLATCQLVEEGILVETPPIMTEFRTFVTPSLSEQQGAIALPSGYRVAAGTAVLFEVKVPEGFVLDGWYVAGGTTAVATTEQALIAIPAPTSNEVITVEARLVAAP